MSAGYCAIVLSAMLGPLGDFYIKKAISSSNLYLIVPFLAWGLVSPLLWYVIYTQLTLTKALVIFAPVSMMLTCALGVLVFKEAMTTRMVFALVFAMAALYLGSE